MARRGKEHFDIPQTSRDHRDFVTASSEVLVCVRVRACIGMHTCVRPCSCTCRRLEGVCRSRRPIEPLGSSCMRQGRQQPIRSGLLGMLLMEKSVSSVPSRCERSTQNRTAMLQVGRVAGRRRRGWRVGRKRVLRYWWGRKCLEFLFGENNC